MSSSHFNPLLLFWLIVSASTGLGIAMLVATFYARRNVLRAVFLTIAIVSFAPPALVLSIRFPAWFDARYRAYQAFYEDVGLGMTRDEVLSTLTRHYPAEGPRSRPRIVEETPSKISFFMNPDHSSCELITLRLESGRVVRKEYVPD